MRRTLRASVRGSGVRSFEGYPRGSIVVCNACAAPLYRLERGIGLGEKAHRCVTAFVPIAVADLEGLLAREDVEAGWRARIQSWTPEARAAHCERLRRPTTGDPMICPSCQGCFVQVLATDAEELHDRAYAIELVTIPPVGRAGILSRLGQTGVWTIH